MRVGEDQCRVDVSRERGREDNDRDWKSMCQGQKERLNEPKLEFVLTRVDSTSYVTPVQERVKTDHGRG